jgi:hypothetical protein
MARSRFKVGKNWKFAFARRRAIWVGWEKLHEQFQFGGNPAGVTTKIKYL